jgi:hypothetical protein
MSSQIGGALCFVLAVVVMWMDPGLHGTAGAVFFMVSAVIFGFVGGMLAEIAKQLTDIQQLLAELKKDTGNV